jgi:hypothetical protein
MEEKNRVQSNQSDKIEQIKKSVAEALRLNFKPFDSVAKKVTDIIVPPTTFARKKWRKVVTGSEDKRIRDLIKEKKDKPQYVKLLDKIAFTLGVLNIPTCQFFMLNRPQYFWMWYIFIMSLLLVSRFFYFRAIQLQYFLYDFCYFTNILSLVCIFYHPAWLFRMVFIFTNGPLMFAILVWRNSLVYHDFDKMTSIYIHILPAMLTLVLKWTVYPEGYFGQLSLWDLFVSCGGYLFWQISYYIKTEVMDKDVLDCNPELLTSLRWLAADKKNSTARAVLSLLRRIGVMRADEDYVSSEFKTKLVFMTSQFVYTVLTFIPSFIVYQSHTWHACYACFIFIVSVYNGASFYIDVFSKRYQLRFEKKEDMHQVVMAAAEMAYHAATSVSRPSAPSPHSQPPSNTETDLQDRESDALGENGDSVERGEIRNAIEAATSAFVDHWAECEEDDASDTEAPDHSQSDGSSALIGKEKVL